jgi:hypothetical protein
MTPILFAFLAIMAPAAVVLGGLAIIKRTARWRESRTKKAQDREMAAHDMMLAGRNRMSNGFTPPKPMPPTLRAVPRAAPRPMASSPTVSAPEPIYPGSVAANPFGYGMPTFDSPAPAASYQGNGGTFDGGGASAYWSCSPSSDSGSSGSDGGSCGSVD